MKNLIPFLTAMLTVAFLSGQAQPKIATVSDSLLLDYYQNHKFAEAANYLKSIYPEPITNPKTLSRLAYTAQMAGKLPEAENYYQRLYNIDSTKTGVLFNLAAINLKRGNTLKAFDYYKRIINIDSTDFKVYAQLAQISAQRNDIPSSVIYLEKANKLNPADPDIASALSDLDVTLKKLPRASSVLSAAIDADPENVTLLESLVKLNYAQKDWPGAIKAGEKLQQLGDNNASIITKLGEAYYFDKNYICSIATLAGLDGLYQNETTYYFTGISYKQVKKQQLAIFYLKKAIDASISPAISSYYGELADTFDNLKEYKKSIATYKQALEYQDVPMAYYSLAVIYDSELKDRRSAVKYYKKYLTCKPPITQQTYVAFTRSRLSQLRSY